jgi:hypothetical protein
MLNVIYSKSNKLFFEGHGSEIGKGGPKRETGDDVEQYYTDYFEDVLGSVRVEYLGMTDYKGEERKNPLFVLS